MKFNYENLPKALCEHNHFCLWGLKEYRDYKDNKEKSLYKGPRSSKTFKMVGPNEDNYEEFEDVYTTSEALKKADQFDGLGVVLDGTGLCCIDLDGINTVSKREFINNLIYKFNTYTEISQSGKGVHIFFTLDNSRGLGLDKENYSKRNDSASIGNEETIGIEFYHEKRSINLTCNRYEKTPIDIKDLTDSQELRDFLDTYLTCTNEENKELSPEENEEVLRAQERIKALGEDRLMKIIGHSKNPNAKRLLEILETGEWEHYKNEDGNSRYPSESHAVFFCITQLAYWTALNPELIYQIFVKTNFYEISKWSSRDDFYKIVILDALKKVDHSSYFKALPREFDSSDTFKDLETEDKKEITSLLDELECNKKGAVLPTIKNYSLILTKDPNLKEKYYYDVFADRRVVSGKLPWHNDTYNLPKIWNDEDEAELKLYLEEHYQLNNGKDNLNNAIAIAFNRRRIHPVKEYLKSLPPWDGVKRVDTLLIDYFGAEDNIYTREVIRKTLLAAVTRAFKPGTKFDNIPVLIGKQGIGKSTFIYTLPPVSDWYVDTDPRCNGRDSFEVLQNKWIVEFGELKSLSRKEAELTKQYITKQSDYYRAPYAKNPVEHPRQCVFMATTNNQTFLNDTTGNRRFWPVQLGINEPIKSVWDQLPKERNQIWAEVYELYKQGESLLLSKAASFYAELEQDNRMEDDPRIGQIVEFIQREIPVDWNTWNKAARLDFWDRDAKGYDIPLKRRDRICAKEIIIELFNIPENYSKRNAKEINDILDNIPGLERQATNIRIGSFYGRQRGYKVTEKFYSSND